MARILFFLFLQTATRRCYQKKSFGRQKVKQTTFGIHSRITVTFTHMHMITFAQCTNPNGLRFWIPRLRFLISDTGFWILCQWKLGFGISIVSGIPYSASKISQISDSTCKNFPDYGVRIPLHAAKTKVPKNMNDFTQYTNCTNVGTVFVVHLIWRGKKLLVWLINENLKLILNNVLFQY